MRFLLGFTALLAALYIGACSTAPATKATTAKADEDFPIIDAHMHTDFEGKPAQYSKIMDSKESLYSELDANHVVGGVVHTQELDKSYFDLHDHHIIDCAGQGATVNVKKLEAGLKDKHYRCVKIYLGYIPQYANDPRYEPAIRLAEKYHVPVVFHTGDTSERRAWVKYSDPMLIDDVAVKFPKVTFVIAHLGNPWVETAAEIVYKNENVYADVSAFLVGNLASRSPEDIQEYVVKPIRWAYGYIEDPKKLMYGTDWPLTDEKSYIWAVKQAIPREHWHDVFYNNAQAVFKIPGLAASLDAPAADSAENVKKE